MNVSNKIRKQLGHDAEVVYLALASVDGQAYSYVDYINKKFTKACEGVGNINKALGLLNDNNYICAVNCSLHNLTFAPAYSQAWNKDY